MPRALWSPRGVGVSYQRGTPVPEILKAVEVSGPKGPTGFTREQGHAPSLGRTYAPMYSPTVGP